MNFMMRPPTVRGLARGGAGLYSRSAPLTMQVDLPFSAHRLNSRMASMSIDSRRVCPPREGIRQIVAAEQAEVLLRRAPSEHRTI